MTRALLDTDILSEILRKRNERVDQAAKRYLDSFDHYTLSVMSVAEVIHGLSRIRNDKGRDHFLNFIGIHEVLCVGIDESILAGEIIAELELVGLPIGHIDPFIAAIALTHRIPLVTGNTRHFQRVKDLGYPLELQNWRLPNG